MSEPNTPDVGLQLPAIDDTVTKQEIYDHLVNFHLPEHTTAFYVGSVWVTGPSAKVTKARLLKFHQEEHAYHDGAPRNGFRYATWVAHTHVSLEDIQDYIPTDDETAMLKAARENKPLSAKPLSATERKVMRELVDNDFNGLKQEAKQFAADALLAAQQEIEAEWAQKVKEVGPRYAKRATDLRRKQDEAMRKLKEKHADEWDALRQQAEADGIEITVLRQEYDSKTGHQVATYTSDVTGRKEALQAATNQNTAFLNRGILALEQQRLAAQRRVLISGVTAEAAAFLDEMPDARTMMVEAQRTQAALETKQDS